MVKKMKILIEKSKMIKFKGLIKAVNRLKIMVSL